MTNLYGVVGEQRARVVRPAVEAVGGDAQVGERELIAQFAFVVTPVVNVADPQVALGVLAPALETESA